MHYRYACFTGPALKSLTKIKNLLSLTSGLVHEVQLPKFITTVEFCCKNAQSKNPILDDEIQLSIISSQVSKGICYGKPSTSGVTKIKATRNLKSVAEERVGRKIGSLRVLNSYWICQDAVNKWYEVIMVDPMHKVEVHTDSNFFVVASLH